MVTPPTSCAVSGSTVFSTLMTSVRRETARTSSYRVATQNPS
jgi:hypothetical protein